MDNVVKKIVLVSKKDLQITWFSGGGGAGGQHKNRHNNCCRIHHPESGVTAQATNQRSATQNRKQAFINLTEKPAFKMWLTRKLLQIREKETEAKRLKRLLDPKEYRIEILQDGQWVEVKEDYFG